MCCPIQALCHPLAGSPQWRHPAQLAASRSWQRQQHKDWPAQSEGAFPGTGTTRLLLQAELQQPGAEQQVHDAAQDMVSAGDVSGSAAAQSAVSLQDAQLAETESLTAGQSGVLQYQMGSSPVIDEQKLIDAAATQASHHLSALPASDVPVRTHELDTWPLVNPTFQPALHEVC